MCGLREVPGRGFSEPATFENVPASQPEGRRELSPAGSGERELSRAQVSPAFEIHPHPPRRNPRGRGYRGAALGVQATRRSGEGWPGTGRLKKKQEK